MVSCESVANFEAEEIEGFWDSDGDQNRLRWRRFRRVAKLGLCGPVQNVLALLLYETTTNNTNTTNGVLHSFHSCIRVLRSSECSGVAGCWESDTTVRVVRMLRKIRLGESCYYGFRESGRGLFLDQVLSKDSRSSRYVPNLPVDVQTRTTRLVPPVATSFAQACGKTPGVMPNCSGSNQGDGEELEKA